MYWELMKKGDQSIIFSARIYKHFTASATNSACMVRSTSINSTRYPQNLQLGFLFDQFLIRSCFVLAVSFSCRIIYACGVDRTLLYLDLVLVCIIDGVSFFPVLDLDLLFLVLVTKTKTSSTRSRSPSSSVNRTVTVSSKPSQPDSFRHRHVKTDSDYHRYLRHFGYFLATATTSWVTATMIALGNLNFKNSSSCYLHALMNIGLDLIQSFPCALTHIDFGFKINLALDVWSSPLREIRRSSETVIMSEGINLIGKIGGDTTTCMTFV